jgi:hypothetical protein
MTFDMAHIFIELLYQKTDMKTQISTASRPFHFLFLNTLINDKYLLAIFQVRSKHQT